MLLIKSGNITGNYNYTITFRALIHNTSLTLFIKLIVIFDNLQVNPFFTSRIFKIFYKNKELEMLNNILRMWSLEGVGQWMRGSWSLFDL